MKLDRSEKLFMIRELDNRARVNISVHHLSDDRRYDRIYTNLEFLTPSVRDDYWEHVSGTARSHQTEDEALVRGAGLYALAIENYEIRGLHVVRKILKPDNPNKLVKVITPEGAVTFEPYNPEGVYPVSCAVLAIYPLQTVFEVVEYATSKIFSHAEVSKPI